MKKALQVLSFATLALLGGCASYGHQNQYASAQVSSDVAISNAVEAAYAQDKRLRHYNIAANTSHGVVALSGYVPSKHLRKHAIYLARTAPGVVAVDASMLHVGHAHHKAATSKAPAHHKKHHSAAAQQSSGSQSSSSSSSSSTSTGSQGQ